LALNSMTTTIIESRNIVSRRRRRHAVGRPSTPRISGGEYRNMLLPGESTKP